MWKREKIATGQWKMRLNGLQCPGIILGGNKNYAVQIEGKQQQNVPRLRDAEQIILANAHRIMLG